MKELRVAYIGIKGLPAWGGAERVVEGIVKKMSGLGVAPVVYCDRRYTPKDTHFDGVRLIRLPTLKGKHSRQLVLDTLSALHAVFLSNYDLIHLQHSESSFLLPLLRLRYKVLTTSHGCPYLRKKWGPVIKFLMKVLDWPFVKLSSKVSFVSAKDAEYFSKRFHQQMTFVPNGVSAEAVPDIQAARKIQNEIGVTPGNYLIFVAGRIDPTKGADLLIKAHASLENRDPLLIVGNDRHLPEYGDSLRKMAGPDVKFLPTITDSPTLFGLMVEAKLLVFPSLLEAMSMVLLESSSLGVPVVASDIPENSAVLKEDGTYFKSEDVASMTEAIKWALVNPDEMRERTNRLRERILREQSWDVIAESYATIYKNLVNRCE